MAAKWLRTFGHVSRGNVELLARDAEQARRVEADCIRARDGLSHFSGGKAYNSLHRAGDSGLFPLSPILVLQRKWRTQSPVCRRSARTKHYAVAEDSSAKNRLVQNFPEADLLHFTIRPRRPDLLDLVLTLVLLLASMISCQATLVEKHDGALAVSGRVKTT